MSDVPATIHRDLLGKPYLEIIGACDRSAVIVATTGALHCVREYGDRGDRRSACARLDAESFISLLEWLEG